MAQQSFFNHLTRTAYGIQADSLDDWGRPDNPPTELELLTLDAAYAFHADPAGFMSALGWRGDMPLRLENAITFLNSISPNVCRDEPGIPLPSSFDHECDQVDQVYRALSSVLRLAMNREAKIEVERINLHSPVDEFRLADVANSESMIILCADAMVSAAHARYISEEVSRKYGKSVEECLADQCDNAEPKENMEKNAVDWLAASYVNGCITALLDACESGAAFDGLDRTPHWKDQITVFVRRMAHLQPHGTPPQVLAETATSLDVAQADHLSTLLDAYFLQPLKADVQRAFRMSIVSRQPSIRKRAYREYKAASQAQGYAMGLWNAICTEWAQADGDAPIPF